ncbi:MAG: ATP-binding cassette domain-containing protein [Spirochaetes bacterium]|nr:ATP-binding cassette domain-containing protein [Spirochaetota bacterium]
MEKVLQTNLLCKSFAGKYAVENVSININKGDIYGFIGENGAGKTTLMRMVCGLAAPTSGEIKLFGNTDLQAQRRNIGCTIETPALYPAMTAIDNMEAQRISLGIKDKSICRKLLDAAGISGTGKKKTKDFSLGMKQRLMIALSLLGSPQLLVLDEPTNGLDPMGIKEVSDFLKTLNETQGTTILVSSHMLGELEKIATRYGVIRCGKMIDEFSAGELPERLGKNLVISCSNPQKAQSIVKNLLPAAVCTPCIGTPGAGNSIRIEGHADQGWRINKTLVDAGLRVNSIVPKGETLEDHFLRLIGGKTNV